MTKCSRSSAVAPQYWDKKENTYNACKSSHISGERGGGGVQDFQIEGRKRLSEVLYGRGQDLEALGFQMLYQAIWILFLKHSDTEMDNKKTNIYSWSNFRGGACLLRPRLDPSLYLVLGTGQQCFQDWLWNPKQAFPRSIFKNVSIAAVILVSM